MTGISLGETDVAAIQELLELAHGDDDGDGVLPWAFLRRLEELVGCEAVTFNGMESSRRSHYLAQSVAADEDLLQVGPATEPEDEVFWAHYWESVPCSYPDVTQDLVSVTSVGDFYSTREWHATPMYQEYFRPQGVEHELMAVLPDGPGRTLRLLCFRGRGRDFGERERFLLRLLRPHVAEAYRVALRRRSGATGLTSRQVQILDLVRAGLTNRQIARRTGLSEGTVRTHLNNIYARLDVSSRTAAVTRLDTFAAERTG